MKATEIEKRQIAFLNPFLLCPDAYYRGLKNIKYLKSIDGMLEFMLRYHILPKKRGRLKKSLYKEE